MSIDQPYLSRRFKLKRFLSLTDEEILENERLWAEEKRAHHCLPLQYARDADWAQHKAKWKIRRTKIVRFLENMAFVAIGATVAWFFF